MTATGSLDPALRELSAELGRMQRRIDQLERNQRASQLEFASIDGGAIVVNDDQGNPMLQLGLQDDGTYSHVHLQSSNAAAPSDPLVSPGIGGIYVNWDGLMADTSQPLSDFDYVQIHVSPISGFTPDATTVVGRLAKAGLYAVGSLTTGVPYYCVLVPVGKDGLYGPQSNQITATPTAVPDNIPPGSVTGQMIGNGAVTGNNIAAGSITTAHLVAGIVVAGIIDATVVNAAVFNGSVFNGTDFIFDPTGNYFYSGFPAAGNLIASIVPPGVTADQFGNATLPIFEVAGVTNINTAGDVIIRNAFGAVVMYLSASNAAFFQYRDLGSSTQGGVILSIASTSGIDPVNGGGYIPGMVGIDPFGNAIQVVGSTIRLFNAVIGAQDTIAIQSGSGATSPAILFRAPEQAGQSGHLVLVMQATSPDGTHLGQFLVGRMPTGNSIPTSGTSALIEFQSPSTGLSDSLLQLITASGGVTTDNMIGFRIFGDNNNRLRVEADGRLRWGPGSATQDTNLYRAGVSILATDDSFRPNTMSVLSAAVAANTVAETVIGTYTIPASDMIAGSSYTFWGCGTASDTLTPTLAIRLRVAGLTGNLIGTTTVLTSRTGTDLDFAWSGRLAFRTIGAASTVDAYSNIAERIAQTGGIGHSYANSGAAAGASTSNITVVVTAQWGTANALNTATATSGTMERIQH